MKLTRETERERDERRVYLAGVINDTNEFNRELIKQRLAHPADVGVGMTRTYKTKTWQTTTHPAGWGTHYHIHARFTDGTEQEIGVTYNVGPGRWEVSLSNGQYYGGWSPPETKAEAVGLIKGLFAEHPEKAYWQKVESPDEVAAREDDAHPDIVAFDATIAELTAAARAAPRDQSLFYRLQVAKRDRQIRYFALRGVEYTPGYTILPPEGYEEGADIRGHSIPTPEEDKS